MVYSESMKHPTKNVHVPLEDQRVYYLSEDELLMLANYAVTIEEHYSQLAGHLQPMDIEWAKDGFRVSCSLCRHALKPYIPNAISM